MAKSGFDPQAASQKWVTNMGSAGTAYTNGVNSVAVSPGQSALQNVQGYLNGVNNAVNNGSYAKGLQSFTLQQWQQSAVSKGAPRLGTGAQAAKSNFTTFMTALNTTIQSAQATIAQMPKGSYEQNMARQRAFADALHAKQGQLKVK